MTRTHFVSGTAQVVGCHARNAMVLCSTWPGRVRCSDLKIVILSLLVACCLSLSKTVAQERGVQLASASSPSVRVENASLSAHWPVVHTSGQFQIHSTVPALEFEQYLPGVCSLPTEISRELNVAITDETIHVVVLESREALDRYVAKLLPNAPSRRALYIRHRGPGLVLTYFHPNWINDVRHECTHALLDASKLRLPVWLDEGIAEYFETSGKNLTGHETHLSAIRNQIRYGQVADLERLEQMEPNATLTAKDYRDAWSIVAFMLNSSEESRSVCCEYLQDLQQERAAGFLSHRLKPTIRSWRESFITFYR